VIVPLPQEAGFFFEFQQTWLFTINSSICLTGVAVATISLFLRYAEGFYFPVGKIDNQKNNDIFKQFRTVIIVYEYDAPDLFYTTISDHLFF
jgi:hypothetical protein